VVEKVEAAEMPEAVITNEALEDWSKRIGAKIHLSNIFNTLASADAIRNFSNGIGDSNLLYLDEEYGKGTRYGALVASPAWTASVFPHWVLQGLPGIHADHSASDWEFLRPIYVNDKITPKCYFVGFDVKKQQVRWDDNL
jgi:acyl dehydratase